MPVRHLGFRPHWFGVATLLTVLTIITSFTVSYLVNHTPFGTVRMIELRGYGGATFEDLRNLELWRVVTAQMLHARMPHMLLNAFCLLLLGGLVEGRIGGLRTFLIWLIAGGVATVISPIHVEAPFNVGTGASQANFAFAGCASVFALWSPDNRKLAWSLIALVVIPGLALDLIFAGYPKPGHLAGFFLGALFGWFFLNFPRADNRVSEIS